MDAKIINSKDLLAKDIMIDRDGMSNILVNDANISSIKLAIIIEDNQYYFQKLDKGTFTTEKGPLESSLENKSNENTPTYTVDDHIIYSPDESSIVVYNTENKVTEQYSSRDKKACFYRKGDKYYVITE